MTEIALTSINLTFIASQTGLPEYGDMVIEAQGGEIICRIILDNHDDRVTRRRLRVYLEEQGYKVSSPKTTHDPSHITLHARTMPEAIGEVEALLRNFLLTIEYRQFWFYSNPQSSHGEYELVITSPEDNPRHITIAPHFDGNSEIYVAALNASGLCTGATAELQSDDCTFTADLTEAATTNFITSLLTLAKLHPALADLV